MGNFALFLSLLSVIIVIHLAIASAIEAYWLTKKRAREQVAKAQLEGTPIRELSITSPSTRVAHDPNADDQEPSETEVVARSDGQTHPYDVDEEAR
ncbi:unnamed protein product, partial [Scytosiphon promiscuus]